MQTKIKIKTIRQDDKTKKYKVEFETDFIGELEDLKDFELDCKMTKYRKKRSVEQNNLMWEFLGRISKHTGAPVTEIYKSEIREIGGTSTTITLDNEKVQGARKYWENQGLGWVTDTYPSEFRGKTNVVLYHGSSSFDTEQMSRLINLVMQDAEALGIDTTPIKELALIKNN